VLTFSHTDPLREPFDDHDFLYAQVAGSLIRRFVPAG
jgi:hypothetical protein